MQSPLEILYQDALNNFDDTLRMLGDEGAKEYYHFGELLARQEEKLAAVLSQDVLDKFTDTWADREYLAKQALFRRGLALGLRLSALMVQ